MHIRLGKIFVLYLIAIFFAMLSLSNIRIVAIANYLPLFDVMIIYYFAVYRPNIFSVWFLFMLGLISDALNGFPLGITSLIYIITTKSFTLFNQKAMVKEHFKQIFQQFITFIFIILFLKWLLLSIYYLKIYNIYPPIIQLIITSSLYVVMHRFFDYLSRTLLGWHIDA